MTKRLAILFGGCLVWVLLMTAPVYADAGPHRGYTGSGTPRTGCASCHRGHTAGAPDLLIAAQPALCFTCHGDSGTGAQVDVEGGLDQTATDPTKTALRGGGFVYSLINTDPAAATGWRSTPTAAYNGGAGAGNIPVLTLLTRKASTSYHTNDGTPASMWGNGAIGDGPGPTVSLYCGSCHDPHGNGQYRILRPIPNNSNAASPGVIIADPSTKLYTTNNYWNVNYTEAPALVANISAWCSTCHTRYLADETASQTSSTDSIFTYRHKTNSTAGYTPVCLQCHVSHGSPATESAGFGGSIGASQKVPLPGGAIPTVAQPGDSRLLRLNDRGVCQMCHLR